MSSQLNVLVYNGAGVGLSSFTASMRTLRQFLGHRYAVMAVDANTLRTQPWESKTALVVIPGGRDKPYAEALHGEANRRIRQWVQGGGRYLGLCAGGYYGSAWCIFEPNTAIEVNGPRDLAFFDGTCLGTAYPGYDYNSEDGARAAEVTVDQAAFRLPLESWRGDPERLRIYYNGGGYFVDADNLENTTVLVRYAPDVTNPLDRAQSVIGAAAVVVCRVGKGTAVLSGLHPEYAWDCLVPSCYTRTHNRHLVEHLKAHDLHRRRLLGALLAHMRLDVDASAMADDAAGGIPKRSPVFLVPARASGVAAAASTMYALNAAADTHRVLRDGADDIHIAAATAHGPHRAPLDRLQAMQPAAEASERGSALLVMCTADAVPERLETPRFDMGLALQHMLSARAHTAGSWLMYADVAESTQTFLEKNLKLQALLPNGTVNVASVQVAGRGRGGNAWISPPGCLQFTMLLRHPRMDQAPVVMLQYLFSLAAVNAIRSLPGYADLPLRLKWPNDIYAQTDSGEYVKIGGLLVTSSFKTNEFTLLFGFGLSVANALPTTSINNLISQLNRRNGTQLPALSVEQTLALITAKFEELYRQFLLRGFAPLLPAYYRYWIHGDQVVTLASRGHESARVVGLCPKDGLLMVRSLLNPTAVYGLEPDGNSFDMMQGLITRKTT
ncbi:biotin-protein ligase [Kickxella alabastrina]|uniref:biotin-protein ligase n=1 Tax=Kickxella alabastrina TaxID=61397 RepID=UPI002220EA84|nr:biotin-protein ligase [Kickxella alabastrina]KAI7834974.1 biotin-protein ligase [Kickxella alabastrina]KAJ1947863.1 biotin holocarboxylase synthetase [Kickxella alabastrina]